MQAKINTPTEDDAPIEGDARTEDGAPAPVNTPVEDTASDAPAEGDAPTEDIAPTVGDVPTEDNAPFEDIALVGDNAPADGDAPTEDIAPGVGGAPIGGDAPFGGITHVEDNTPAEGDASARAIALAVGNAKFATHPHSLLSLCYLNIPMPYMRSRRKLLFFSLTIVALTGIVIQLALEMEAPRSSPGSMSPGWAQHRNEGWEYHKGE